MVKNKKWSEFLTFQSVKNYLMGAMGSKNALIGSNSTLEAKLENANLSNYLKGLESFFIYSQAIFEKGNYEVVFKYPSDIISHYKIIRDDEEKVSKFKQLGENFIVWLKNDAVMNNGTVGYKGTTAMSFQAHFRGFLKWNNISLKFRNYNERSEKAKKRSKFGISFEVMKEMGMKVIGYIKDYETKNLCKIVFSTGLGGREIREIKFGDIRYLPLEDDYVRIDGERKKTGIVFSNFFYGETKEFIVKWIKNNTDKDDEDYIFGNNLTNVYQKHQRIFRTAFETLIRSEYKKLAIDLIKKDKNGEIIYEKNGFTPKIDTSFFSIHTFRGIFITTCKNLRVPLYIEETFVSHSGDKLSGYNITGDILLENYKLVVNDIFGGQSDTTTIQEAKRQIIESLFNSISNDGKRTTTFMEYQDKPIGDLTTDIQTQMLIQSIIEKAKQETIATLKENFVLIPKTK